LGFRHQRQKQGRLGSLIQADLGRFASFATFCENCFFENIGAPCLKNLNSNSIGIIF
jgi:hypothetical protein